MEIKKTDIVQIRKEDFLELIESCDSKQVEEEMKSKYPEAFEPEYRECLLSHWELLDNAIDRVSPYKRIDIDTGNWRIFDGGDSFYVVHKDLKDAIQFPKDSSGTDWNFLQDGRKDVTTIGIEKLIEYLKERK